MLVETLEDVYELNRQAVKDGLMLPDDAPFSHDDPNELGKELPTTELQVYLALAGRLDQGATVKDLFNEVSSLTIKNISLYNRDNYVWVIIDRIRARLGEESIINDKPSHLYFARSARPPKS